MTTLYTDPDSRAQHALSSPFAFNLGSVSAYLDGDRVIEIAKREGCQGIHPGYGFVSTVPLQPIRLVRVTHNACLESLVKIPHLHGNAQKLGWCSLVRLGKPSRIWETRGKRATLPTSTEYTEHFTVGQKRS